MEEVKVIIFGDTVGRLIIGTKVSEDDSAVVVEHPYVITSEVVENQQKLGLYPFVFIDLVETAEGQWTFNKSNYAFNTLNVSKQAVDMYQRMVSTIRGMVEQKNASVAAPVAAPVEENTVVNFVD